MNEIPTQRLFITVILGMKTVSGSTNLHTCSWIVTADNRNEAKGAAITSFSEENPDYAILHSLTTDITEAAEAFVAKKEYTA